MMKNGSKRRELKFSSLNNRNLSVSASPLVGNSHLLNSKLKKKKKKTNTGMHRQYNVFLYQ